MVEIVLQRPSKWVVIANALASDRALDGRKEVLRQSVRVKSNPLAMVDFPELHSQKRGNP
jgi:hypothetical protein